MLRIIFANLMVTAFFFTSTAQAGMELETAPASMEKVMVEQYFDGVVEAVKQSTVAAQIAGRITEIHFDVDDMVEKNSILLRIYDKEYKARTQQAEAALAEAKARHKDAEAEHKRIKGLLADKMVSESEFDKAEAALSSAIARIKAAEGQLTEVAEQFENTVIRAPYSGIVVKRNVQPGETVRMGDPVMTGFSMEQMRVNVDIPQNFIDAVREYKTASIYREVSGESIKSKSLTIFPYADAQTHAFRVRVELNKDAKGMYPGMMVKAGFTVKQKDALLVPSSAVAHRVEVEAVYVVDDAGKIRMRQVRTGRVENGKTEILSGLDAGEKVALDPLRAVALLKAQMGAK